MSDIEVTVSLLALRNEQNQIRTFIHQNAPEFKVEGGCADLRLPEVLELLSFLGATADEAQKTVEAVFAEKTILAGISFFNSDSPELYRW